jgi:hypothetical protein
MQRKEPLEDKGVAGIDALAAKKHFDTSGKSLAHLHHPRIGDTACGTAPQRFAPGLCPRHHRA